LAEVAGYAATRQVRLPVAEKLPAEENTKVLNLIILIFNLFFQERKDKNQTSG
jgi:hypothetical protein